MTYQPLKSRLSPYAKSFIPSKPQNLMQVINYDKKMTSDYYTVEYLTPVVNESPVRKIQASMTTKPNIFEFKEKIPDQLLFPKDIQLTNEEKTKYKLVLSHKGCPDGIASSWVYFTFLRQENKTSFRENGTQLVDAVFYPAIAGKFTDIDYKDQDLIMFDVSKTSTDLIKVAKVAKSITILDHHHSLEKEMAKLTPSEIDKLTNVKILYDVERSGAQITWDFFFPDKKRPWFIDIIADRDLWKWQIANSKSIGAYLYQNGYYTWKGFDSLMSCAESSIEKFSLMGQVLLDAEAKEINENMRYAILTKFSIPIIKNNEKDTEPLIHNEAKVEYKDYRVYLVGCRHSLASETCNLLAKKDCDFAAAWRYDFLSNEFWVSCRSVRDDVDLTQILKSVKGGGHVRAAGFSFKNTNEGLGQYFKEIVNIQI